QPGPDADELRLGPPRTVALPVKAGDAEGSPDGSTLAIVGPPGTGGTGLVVDLASDSVRAQRFEHAAADSIALSRNGRWLATGGWHSEFVRLWKVETGTMVKEWRRGRAMVFFTPDSRALIICEGDGFSIWDLATLQLIRQIPREVAHYPGR